MGSDFQATQTRKIGAAAVIGTTKYWLLELLERCREKAVQDDEQTWDDVARYDAAIRLVEQGPEEPKP